MKQAVARRQRRETTGNALAAATSMVFDVEGEQAFQKGPILRFPLPVFTPHLLHGSFAEGVIFPFEES